MSDLAAVRLDRRFFYGLLRQTRCANGHIEILLDGRQIRTLQGLLHAAALELEGQR